MRLFFKVLACIGGLFFGVEAVAQMPAADPFEHIDTLRVVGLKHGPHWVVKLSPLAFLDVESLYRVDVERMLGGRFSVQGGMGYGSQNTQLWQNSTNSNVQDREVWRAQLEGRVYVNRDRRPTRWQPGRLLISKPLGQYFAVETFYKQANARYTGTLSRGCDTGNCQFFESYSARAIRYVAGFHLKFGRQNAIQLSETNSRLLIDYYVGLGARWRWFEQRGVPTYDDSRPATFFSDNFDPTSSWGSQAGRFPSLAFGIQVGYAF